MVSFWVPILIRHLIFRVPKKVTIILTSTQIYIYILRLYGGYVGVLFGLYWGSTGIMEKKMEASVHFVYIMPQRASLGSRA